MTIIHHASSEAEKNVSVKLPRWLLIWFGILSLLAAIGFFIFIAFAIMHWRSGFGRTLSHVVPFPAAVVGGEVVWYSEVVELSSVLDQFSDDSKLSDSFDRAMTLVVRRRYIEELAKELGVTVDDGEIIVPDQALRDFMASSGWNDADYLHYVARPLLLAQKTELALQSSDQYQEIARRKLDIVQADLEIGISFSDIANQYSEDSSAAYNGDIGYFRRADLPVGLEQVFDVPLNEPTDIIETADGFVVAMVYDVVEADGERQEVAVRIIKARKATLAEVLDEYSKSRGAWYIVR